MYRSLKKRSNFTRGAFPPSIYYIDDPMPDIASGEKPPPSPADDDNDLDPNTGSYEFVDPADVAAVQARFHRCTDLHSHATPPEVNPLRPESQGHRKQQSSSDNRNPRPDSEHDYEDPSHVPKHFERIMGVHRAEYIRRSSYYDNNKDNKGAINTTAHHRLDTKLTDHQVNIQLDAIIGDLRNEILGLDRSMERYHSS